MAVSNSLTYWFLTKLKHCFRLFSSWKDALFKKNCSFVCLPNSVFYYFANVQNFVVSYHAALFVKTYKFGTFLHCARNSTEKEFERRPNREKLYEAKKINMNRFFEPHFFWFFALLIKRSTTGKQKRKFINKS